MSVVASALSDRKKTRAISAALFLAEFAGEFPWVHLDVAGTAYTEADIVTVPRGPTGVPVGTFVEFVRGRAG